MDLGSRMKAYEEASRLALPIRIPVIIRVDGKAFHSLTRHCCRPFDGRFHAAMTGAATDTLQDIPARMAYQQSDEVSFLLIDYNKFDSEQWFRGVVQKMASVAASVMAVRFVERWHTRAFFDGRVFAVPERDIENYFVWRQRDCMRNAISMAAQAHFSAKQLLGKNSDEMTRMLAEKRVKFDQYPDHFRYGSIVQRYEEPKAAPIFTKNRDVLKGFLAVEDE